MSSGKQDHQENAPRGIDVSDIANSGTFMDAFVAFLNEAYICMQEVRVRSGVSPGCGTSVSMNDEEKEDRLKIVLTSVSEKCEKEASQRPAQNINDESNDFPLQDDECNCPPDLPMSSPSRYSRGRRPESTRPGASQPRSRVATPDQFYMPSTQSAMSSPTADYSQMGYQCPTYSMMARSRTAPRPSSRSGSPSASSYGDNGCPPNCGQLGGGRQYRR